MKRYCDICEEKEGSFNWTSEDEVVEEIYEGHGDEGE